MFEFDDKFTQAFNLIRGAFSSDLRHALQLEQDIIKLVQSDEKTFPVKAVQNINGKLLANNQIGERNHDGTRTTIQKEITVGALSGLLAQDPRHWVRAAAAQALSGVHHPVAIEQLARATLGSNSAVSSMATASIIAVVRSGKVSPDDRQYYFATVANAILEALLQKPWPKGSRYEKSEQNKAATGITDYSPRDDLHILLRQSCENGRMVGPIIKIISNNSFSDQDRCRALHLCYFQGAENRNIFSAAARIAENESEPELVRRYADRLACLGVNAEYKACFDADSYKELEGGD